MTSNIVGGTVWVCEKCGTVDMVKVDAYAMFDRAGEGVMFEVRAKNGKLVVEPDAEAAAYLRGSRFNVKAWNKDMKTYAEETDMVACGKCGHDIYLD